jgi:hypothetical protein
VHISQVLIDSPGLAFKWRMNCALIVLAQHKRDKRIHRGEARIPTGFASPIVEELTSYLDSSESGGNGNMFN